MAHEIIDAMASMLTYVMCKKRDTTGPFALSWEPRSNFTKYLQLINLCRIPLAKMIREIFYYFGLF